MSVVKKAKQWAQKRKSEFDETNIMYYMQHKVSFVMSDRSRFTFQNAFVEMAEIDGFHFTVVFSEHHGHHVYANGEILTLEYPVEPINHGEVGNGG